MDLKKEKPALEDVEDKRGSNSPSVANKSRSFRPVERAEKRKKAEQNYRDRMIREIGRTSKSPSEYNKRVSEFEKNVKQAKDEADQSADDATRAWEENFSGKKSPEMEEALKDISGVTKKFDDKKIKKAASYASGGVVRGFGKARGAKPIKIR